MVVNWSILEKNLKKFKSGAAERMAPLDQMDLTQMIEPQKKPSNTTHDLPSQDSQNVRIMAPVIQENSDTVEFIEVENIKGQIKKINPNEYEVVIQGKDGSTYVCGNIKSIASGIYQSIFEKYGAKQALECIIRDYRNTSKKTLSFTQAKMVVSSLIRSGAAISDKSVKDILSQMSSEDSEQMTQWISSRNS